MPEIHPTAIINGTPDLADDVVIGPNCILEGEIAIAAGTRLIANVHLNGPITIGARNTIYPGACLGFAPQFRGRDHNDPGTGTKIGDENILREGVSIHRGTGLHADVPQPTTLGNGNYLMAYSHVGHDCVIGNDNTFANNSLIAGHVEVGDGVLLGGSAGIHQFCRVGRLAVISGNEGVSQDLPPFCVCHQTREVASLNLVGLRRSGNRKHVGPLKRAFDLLYRKKLSNSGAVERIRAELGDDPLCCELADFVASTKRGITRYIYAHGSDAQPS